MRCLITPTTWGYLYHNQKACRSPGLNSPHIRSSYTHHTPQQGFLLLRPQTTCHILNLGSSYLRPLKFHHLLNLVPPPHQPSLGLSLSNLGHQLLINTKSHYLPGLPSSGPHLQRLCILPSTVSSPTSPSTTMTISALGEFLTTPFHPTLPSLLPLGRLWHQHDLLPEPQSTTYVYEQEVKPQGNRE